MALNSAAVLCGAVCRNDSANEYRDMVSALIRAVNAHCFDSNQGLYLDGPGASEQISQHVQIFAVLADAIRTDAAKNLMRKTTREREALGLANASFAMSFYMFRAVEKAGIYEEVWGELLEPEKKCLTKI